MNAAQPIAPTRLGLMLIMRLAWRKLLPSAQLRNPTMFTVYVATWLVTGLLIAKLLIPHLMVDSEPLWFIAQLTGWLWLMLIGSSIAEAIAEGHAKTQIHALRSFKQEIKAKKLKDPENTRQFETVFASALHSGDYVLVENGDPIPADGEVLGGIASVDESAITGESAPVIREAGGGEHSFVTGGTRILSDWLVIRVNSEAGEGYIDRMISLVQGAKRHKTPSEAALNTLLISMTIIYLMTVASLLPFTLYAVDYSIGTEPVSLSILIALFVCLAPTTIGGLLSAIGISGMNRLLKANVIAMTGRSVEAAGDVHWVLLDKTGTITYGNRQAEQFFPAKGVSIEDLADIALKSSLADSTPEGKSIVQLARNHYGVSVLALPEDADLIPFSAEERISGVRENGVEMLKGAADAIAEHLAKSDVTVPDEVQQQVEEVARQGATPLVVIEGLRVMGVIYLKDIVKPGIKEKLGELRALGVKSLLITGDNPITAAVIAAEAGVDDYLAQATPEKKLTLIRERQAKGEMVAMVGDGTNDAPALAQSNVAVVMNTGTEAAKEAANMIDLDSDPTKLLDIVRIGKQLLMTRGTLTTLSFANDIAKYFAVVPAALVGMYPTLQVLNIMNLTSPLSAVLAAVIFNSLMLVLLIPRALVGIRQRPLPTNVILRQNLLVYGVVGILIPFAGIKAIDTLLAVLGMV